MENIILKMDIKPVEALAKLYGKPISEEEYREICENLHGFFITLTKWDEGERKSRGNSKPKEEV